MQQKFISQYNKKNTAILPDMTSANFSSSTFLFPWMRSLIKMLFVIVPVAAHNIIALYLCHCRGKYRDHNTTTYYHFTAHHEGRRLKNKEAMANCTGKIKNNPGSKSPTTLLTSGKVASVNFTSLTKTCNKQYLTTLFKLHTV